MNFNVTPLPYRYQGLKSTEIAQEAGKFMQGLSRDSRRFGGRRLSHSERKTRKPGRVNYSLDPNQIELIKRKLWQADFSEENQQTGF